MNGGFWDAVDRAALGRSAAATPRARSPFEMEQVPEGLDAIDVEADAPPLRETGERVVAAVAPLPVAPRDDPVDAPPAAKGGAPAIEPVRDDRSAPVHDAPAVERVVVMEPAATVRAPVAVEPRAIERLEIHRHETIHRVDATPAQPAIPARDERIASPAAGPGLVEAAPAAILPIREPQHDERMPAEAEPIPQPREPRQAAATQAPAPQPLVIEIDRIEIRIEPERAAPAPGGRAKDAAVAVSLEEYLARPAAGAR